MSCILYLDNINLNPRLVQELNKDFVVNRASTRSRNLSAISSVSVQTCRTREWNDISSS